MVCDCRISWSNWLALQFTFKSLCLKMNWYDLEIPVNATITNHAPTHATVRERQQKQTKYTHTAAFQNFYR